ncbi:MAG: TldD/PmbA family protein [Actinobacteria bacterium]|nr:TldD/PmbA family protein [Actinomycetota bacterium]
MDFIQKTFFKTFLAVSIIAVKGSEARTGYKSLAKTKGFELFNEKKPEDVALEAAAMAINMLDAVNAPVGIQPVVIGPGFGGVIFHEACGHGLEADAIIKNASVFKDKIGCRIASETVTAIDDSTLKYHWGSYKFDDEGHPSQRNVLIEKGILKSYLLDVKSSKKLSLPQTGNGRRQSYRDIPFPRMSNTFIDNGTEKPDTLLGSVKKGIYAKEFSGGQVDPATGDFVFGISEGYMIENGKLGYPIKGATLIGNGPEILGKIEAVGNDIDYAPGFCGKNGQSITNEVGQPTIKVSSITVGGTGAQ